MVRRLTILAWNWRIWRDCNGQDVLEYALYVAAIGVLYVAFSPSVASDVANILTKVNSTLVVAAGTGGSGG